MYVAPPPHPWSHPIFWPCVDPSSLLFVTPILSHICPCLSLPSLPPSLQFSSPSYFMSSPGSNYCSEEKKIQSITEMFPGYQKPPCVISSQWCFSAGERNYHFPFGRGFSFVGRGFSFVGLVYEMAPDQFHTYSNVGLCLSYTAFAPNSEDSGVPPRPSLVVSPLACLLSDHLS